MHTKTYPLGTQCSTWGMNRPRCTEPAAAQLFAPDGTPVPGGPICRSCADRIVKEYADKLVEHWSAREIVVLPH